MSTLLRALRIAAERHAGQTDLGGAPYISHIQRVMDAVESRPAKIVAALHDVVEDTPTTLEELYDLGFPIPIIAAVDALTRRDGEDYERFIERVAMNALATEVKIADLRDNLREDRRRPDKPHLVARYRKALAYLEEHGLAREVARG